MKSSVQYRCVPLDIVFIAYAIGHTILMFVSLSNKISSTSKARKYKNKVTCVRLLLEEIT